MLRKDDKYSVIISDMNSEGNGVCRVENTVVFVIGGVTGDECVIKIIKVTKKYCVAVIDSLISPSSHRREPLCPYKRCGGCVFRNITEGYELEIKKRVVEGAFLRAGISIPVGQTYGGAFSAYRNKAQFPVGYDKNGRLSFGYYAKRSHDIVFCDRCDIADPEFTGIAKTVCASAEKHGVSGYDEQSGKGVLRHICMRSGESGVMLTLVINADALPCTDEIIKEITDAHPRVTGVYLNVNKENTNVIYGDKFIHVKGDKKLTDNLCGNEFETAPSSFYQVNHECCEALYSKAAELLDIKGTETVIDLYCGVGTVGICAAKNAKKLIGIEIVPDAVENAKKNAEINGVKNAEFYQGDSSMIGTVTDRADIIIVDPPRKGLDGDVIRAILDIKPEKLLYISCDPNTLARDLKILLKQYTAEKAYPFNMFPRTSHVETVTLITRGG